jgi:multicomponent Na+:H+ antiporter subunit C
MQALQTLAGHYNYVVTIFLMMAGLYIMIARGNMLKKLVGLGIFQTSVYLLYLEPAKVIGGTAPILDPDYTLYTNPLPHVLILTAIVVGVATLALGLALVVRINEAFGTMEEDEIFEDIASAGISPAELTPADLAAAERSLEGEAGR